MTEQDVTDADGEGDDPEEGADAGLEEIAAEPAEGAFEEIVDGADPEELTERVAEADPAEIAGEIDALRSRLADLQATLEDREEEIEDLEDRLRRKQAEFQNYKKRQQSRLEDQKERATEDLVRRLLDVRDNLARALDQDEDTDIRGGVESTLAQFDEQFAREGVEPIDPDPGEQLDPQRHEALATVDSEQPSGTVADLHRPGYEMSGKILRPAQVAVSGDEE